MTNTTPAFAYAGFAPAKGRVRSRWLVVLSAATVSLAIMLPTVLKAQDVLEIQTKLTEIGCYDGPVNGKRSLALRTAIRCFQKRAGLQPTGAPNEETMARLITGGDLAEVITVTGPCRATEEAIECALSDGSYSAAPEPWRGVAAKQLALTALECFDGPITGIEDTDIARGITCVREKFRHLDGFRRESRFCWGSYRRKRRKQPP